MTGTVALLSPNPIERSRRHAGRWLFWNRVCQLFTIVNGSDDGCSNTAAVADFVADELRQARLVVTQAPVGDENLRGVSALFSSTGRSECPCSGYSDSRRRWAWNAGALGLTRRNGTCEDGAERLRRSNRRRQCGRRRRQPRRHRRRKGPNLRYRSQPCVEGCRCRCPKRALFDARITRSVDRHRRSTRDQ